ncbi:MocR-like transcription factor YczR [Streptomyces halobius]|uniref:PLP-dependent aminotransferase family protein n=1 Tax=Streptomyces halobius TaxID=2879846 RepID=A0ABY4MDP0_9ACTN|nr:PLP-dependent aminotransferase family protein [Streptomyces halobius]UQA95805.1 PLP-dependent aminotransferase family protein [Streptomyces halobius]
MADIHVDHSVDRTLGSHRLAGLLSATAGDRPGYRALAQGVRTLLLDGRIALHTRLPAERELASALGVSRATVTAAYDLLREGGYAHSRRGSGTWTVLPEGRRPSNVAAFTPKDDLIDLALAAPFAPQSELAEALGAASAQLPRLAATAGYHPYGLPELRAAVADRFTRRGLPTLPDQILITSGAQQAVSLTLGLLGRPGDRVLVENPSYAVVLDALRRSGLRTTPVPVTEDGWDSDLAESALRQAAPRLAYLVPDFHNPTGNLMPAEQRLRLLDAARRTGTWMIVDETLTDIALDVPAPAPFAALATHRAAEQLVTVGSLSKTHWGGLRIGWARASSQLVTELATHRVPTDIATSALDQLVAIGLLERTDAVLAQRLPRLRAQRDALAAALADQLPDWRWRLPPGGLSLWVDLGRPVASALAAAALDHGVRIEGGARFGADPGTFEHRLRIPYTLPEEVCTEAVQRIAAAVDGELAVRVGDTDRTRWVA